MIVRTEKDIQEAIETLEQLCMSYMLTGNAERAVTIETIRQGLMWVLGIDDKDFDKMLTNTKEHFKQAKQ